MPFRSTPLLRSLVGARGPGGALLLLGAILAASLLGACSGTVVSGEGGGGAGGSTTSAGGGAGGSTGTNGGAGGTLTFSCTGKTVSYAADVEPIVHCGGAEFCHQLSLGKPGGAYGWLVGQPTEECKDGRLRVSPGDPEHSYLVDKLTNHALCDGVPMPKNPSGWDPLPSDQIQTVYDWICQGAKDD